MMVSLCAPGLAVVLCFVLVVCVMSAGSAPSNRPTTVGSKSHNTSAAPGGGGTMKTPQRRQCCESMFYPYRQMCYGIDGFAGSHCCDAKLFDSGSQLCCGCEGNRVIWRRESAQQRCCGRRRYDSRTHHCCPCDSAGLCIRPLNETCQEADEVGLRRLVTSSCGSGSYNPINELCCKGVRKVAKETLHDLCCGLERYNPMSHSCTEGLHIVPIEGQGRGSMSPSTNVPEPLPLPQQHLCGQNAYSPETEICCNGHRHASGKALRCCGDRAYNVTDPRLRCCSGTLYNTAPSAEVKCCASVLQNQSDVCCVSEDMAMPYAAKEGFLCCRHFYYNSNLWSCAAGNLIPAQPHNRKISTKGLQPLNNLNNRNLCQKIHIGTVESVTLSSVVFSDVLEVNGNGTMKPLISPYKVELELQAPRLTPGKTYFFHAEHFYTDFNHHSVLQSLHFIFSKCMRM